MSLKDKHFNEVMASIEEQMAMEAYPVSDGPCDKPNLKTDDMRVLLWQREAYIKGLKDGQKLGIEKAWHSTEEYPSMTCRVLLQVNGTTFTGGYGSQHGIFYSDDAMFKTRKWAELPDGMWANMKDLIPE